jgi:hypothetical protein
MPLPKARPKYAILSPTLGRNNLIVILLQMPARRTIFNNQLVRVERDLLVHLACGTTSLAMLHEH